MNKSLLEGKKILAVDDEPDVLVVLEEEIKEACPSCTFEKAVTYEEAMEKLEKNTYDIVILDIMGVRGFDLLEYSVKKGLKVVMLTAQALNADALQKSYQMKAHGYLPKDKLGEIVPFLEDVLQYDFSTGWKRLLSKLEDFFDKTFDPGWRNKIGY
ncbi:MAG TPA: response regulator [Syntrophorhabdaceae bacterium]|nr:response regulator [Syntrophorhabdaceae bacterium]HOL06595.1 response regulator [Syntrophorhabdaceae bacterium]HON85516.1 response regulator [Syntrophorhabdaceae bacterium]HOT43113.1 response regulator [Syntrophorhabdaceae bacterium]HPC66322.1 response regulator [Syntrophorhabdaceae bacterium]